MDIIESLQEKFCSIILPAIGKDVVGTVSVDKQKKIDTGKSYDIRVPRMMYYSGKGDSQHTEYRNVTLLNHVTEVAFKAANFVIMDYKNILDVNEISKIAALCIIIGLLHDVNKMHDDNGKTVSDYTEEYFNKYMCHEYLTEFGLNDITGSDIKILIEYVENRTTGQTVSIPERIEPYISIVGKYVKISDALDSRFLRGTVNEGLQSALKYFDDSLFKFNNPDAFKVSKLEFYDVNYPNINISLLQEISNSCLSCVGHRPLLHVYADGNFVSLLPSEHKEEIINNAIENLKDIIFYNMKAHIYVSPKKAISISGKRVSFNELKKIVKENYDNSNFMSFKITSRQNEMLWNKAIDLINKMNLETTSIFNGAESKSKMGNIFDFSNEDSDSNYIQLVVTYILLSMKETNKKFTSKKRMQEILNIAPIDMKEEWEQIENVMQKDDDLLGKSLFAILIYLYSSSNPDFYEKIYGDDGLFKSWLPKNNEGIMKDCIDNISSMQDALDNYININIKKIPSIELDKFKGFCYFTGEPISMEQQPVCKADGLIGVKTSAFSNREGTPEFKEKDISSVFVSPLMKLELIWREDNLTSKRYSEDKPMTITSPISFGMGNYMVNINEVKDFNTSEVLTEDIKKNYVDTMFILENTCTVGRRQTIDKKLADQISTIRKILISAQRLGRPIHVFGGIPYETGAYVFFDCLPPILSSILGKNEWRLDELPEVIKNISLIQTISEYSKETLYMLTQNDKYNALCHIYKVFSDKQKIPENDRIHLMALIESEKEKNMDNPIMKLANIAARIQMVNIQRTTDTVDAILIREAFDKISCMTPEERMDTEYAVAQITGGLLRDLERRHKSNSFFARSELREGRKLEDCMEDFVRTFVVDFFQNYCKNKLVDKKKRRQYIDTFCYTRNRESKRLNSMFSSQSKKDEKAEG